MNRKTFVAVSASLLMILLLSACGTTATPTVAPTTAPTTAPVATTAPTTAPTKAPVTIIIGTTDKIASLDSADAYATHDWEILKNISDGLLTWKPGTTDLEPDLATDMGKVSSDGLTYTFTL